MVSNLSEVLIQIAYRTRVLAIHDTHLLWNSVQCQCHVADFKMVLQNLDMLIVPKSRNLAVLTLTVLPVSGHSWS